MTLFTAVGGSNAQVPMTFAGLPGRYRQVTALHWSLSADPAAGVLLTIASTGVNTYTVYVTRGGPGTLDFQEPFTGGLGADVVVTLGGGGGTIIGTLNVYVESTS